MPSVQRRATGLGSQRPPGEAVLVLQGFSPRSSRCEELGKPSDELIVGTVAF